MSGYYVIESRTKTILIFEKAGDVNYCASCQVNVIGDRAEIHTANGHKFYEVLAEQAESFFSDLKVKQISAYVTKAHARLMKMMLKKVNVTIESSGKIGGHNMIWIVLRLKNEPAK